MKKINHRIIGFWLFTIGWTAFVVMIVDYQTMPLWVKNIYGFISGILVPLGFSYMHGIRLTKLIVG